MDPLRSALGLTLFEEASDFDADIQLAFRFRKMGSGVDFGAGPTSTPGLVEGDAGSPIASVGGS